MPEEIQKVAVMGAGAVGSFFGGMLARAGAEVTLIARGAHLEALQRERPVHRQHSFSGARQGEASGDPAAVRGAELILFCVKIAGYRERRAVHRPAPQPRRRRADPAKWSGQRRKDPLGHGNGGAAHRRLLRRGSVGAGPHAPCRPRRLGDGRYPARPRRHHRGHF